MSDSEEKQKELLKGFAYIIFSGIQRYICENRDAYEQWLKEQNPNSDE